MDPSIPRHLLQPRLFPAVSQIRHPGEASAEPGDELAPKILVRAMILYHAVPVSDVLPTYGVPPRAGSYVRNDGWVPNSVIITFSLIGMRQPPIP